MKKLIFVFLILLSIKGFSQDNPNYSLQIGTDSCWNFPNTKGYPYIGFTTESFKNGDSLMCYDIWQGDTALLTYRRMDTYTDNQHSLWTSGASVHCLILTPFVHHLLIKFGSKSVHTQPIIIRKWGRFLNF